jgi:FKBP-type peptidyl-prolyl cis-trans isomerase 2
VLEIHDPENGAMSARITNVTQSTVTLDANHPLAGKDLTLDIEVLAVR